MRPIRNQKRHQRSESAGAGTPGAQEAVFNRLVRVASSSADSIALATSSPRGRCRKRTDLP